MGYLLGQEIDYNIYIYIMEFINNIQNLKNNIILAHSLLLHYTILV
jgi:hypothetical protein